MDAITIRVAMVKGAPDVPDTTKEAMKEVDWIIGNAADDLKRVLTRGEHNVGCVIATMDLLRDAKYKAECALVAPYYAINKEQDEKSGPA